MTPTRMIEGSLLALGIVMVGTFVFANCAGRTGDLAGFTLRADPAAHLGSVAFRTERNQRGHAGGHVSSDLGAMHGRGPFLLQSPAENALALQMFLIVTGTPLMFLSVLLEDDRRSQQALHEVEEDARRHREQINLLSRVSLLGEMTASLAHELNQPLSAIISNANAGMRFIDRGKEDPADLRDILVDVESDGHRAHDIIQNVRNTIKKGDPTRRQIDLNELVTKCSACRQARCGGLFLRGRNIAGQGPATDRGEIRSRFSRSWLTWSVMPLMPCGRHHRANAR